MAGGRPRPGLQGSCCPQLRDFSELLPFVFGFFFFLLLLKCNLMCNNTKYPDAGRDWGQEEKGTTEDEMAGWHHRLEGHEFEYTPGVGDGQGGLVCCDSWGRKESDTTE